MYPSYWGGPMSPGNYPQAGLSSGTVLQGTSGYTQLSREEEVASPAKCAVRYPGEGSCVPFSRHPDFIGWSVRRYVAWTGLRPTTPETWWSDPPHPHLHLEDHL